MDAYAEIVTWENNFFEPPKENAVNYLLTEIVRTSWEHLPLHQLNIFITIFKKGLQISC